MQLSLSYSSGCVIEEGSMEETQCHHRARTGFAEGHNIRAETTPQYRRNQRKIAKGHKVEEVEEPPFQYDPPHHGVTLRNARWRSHC